MGQYALKSDLPDTRGFAKLTDVERYVDNRYVTHSQLAEYRYVNRRELEDAISNISNITIPSGATDMDRDLELRVHALELEVLRPGGAFAKMEETLKVIQSRKAGSAVQAGPYSFKDAASTDAWAVSLGDPDIVRYFVDARMQLAALNTSQRTEASLLQEEANARKANFSSSATAKIATSFLITFPEAIFRDSTAAKDAPQGG